ncbi:sulfite exporter TauE/SafE family protein, partial [Phycicoccus flavus]
PAKQSTAAILAVLVVGDLVAVWHYRRDADWGLVRRLLPAVLPGLAIGAAFLAVVDDDTLRRSIGVVLLVLVGLQLWVRRSAPAGGGSAHERPAAAWGAGTAAGFATMTANAAGPVMTLYLSAAGIDKRRFVGTNAWFFLVVNLVKVPFSVGLGLLHWDDVGRAGLLAPLVVLGGVLGSATIARISQRGFDVAVLLASALAAAALLLG